ncbi:putativeras-related protein Rab-39A [Pyrenophora tritici-repentis]|uniref:GTPase SAR1 and related small G protein n=1 Tax=Pyrenophora tritici-repentis TaxID=45151 RepID=A0A2W1FTY5_9PLEO|nr:putativeras-related protein Rab-39A [Pyrenophora tritici-repentis]KAF7568093.1 GTPase SAR1 and related small G protein [Pyrenophora tritici-repentis]KAI0572631.1 ras-related protein Rab-39A [Pyrenophora tritici-repentis]PZD24631.1 GTPase SAR1 small G protein [Pyrenophora tritici-repentis]
MLFKKSTPPPTPLKVVVLGDWNVGKTSFMDMFLHGKPFIHYPLGEEEAMSQRTICYANQDWNLSLMDLVTPIHMSSKYREVFHGYLSSADGVILLYDITDRRSFEDPNSPEHNNPIKDMYEDGLYCRNSVFTRKGTEGGMVGLKKRFGCVLVGNKRDLVDQDEDKRQVKKEMAQQHAASQGFKHFEISSLDRGEIERVMEALIDRIQKARWMDARDVEDGKSDAKKEKAERGEKTLISRILKIK